jgi:hypothetical protein
MHSEIVWELIAHKLSGEASEQEIRQLQNLQRRHPEISYYMEMLSVWWNMSERFGKEEAAKAFDKHLQKLEKENANLVRHTKISQRSAGENNDNKPARSNFLKKLSAFKTNLKNKWRNITGSNGYKLLV